MRPTLTCLRSNLTRRHAPSALLCALTLALSACGDDTSGTGGGSTSGSPTGDPTGDPSTSAPSSTSGDTNPTTSGDDNSASEAHTDTTAAPQTTTSASATAEPDTTGGTTTAADDTTTSPDDTTTSPDDTTGGVMLGCDFIGPELDAILVHDGNPPPPCGTFVFDGGQNINMDAGPVYHLDGCPCNSDCFAPDPWTFTLVVPDEALPAIMPVCPRIVVERQMSKQGCELVGVSIYEAENDDWPHPYYVAGSLLGPPAAAAADLGVEQHSVEMCDCDGCCNPPERYDLEFTVKGDIFDDPTLTLAENSDGKIADDLLDAHYAVYNYQSHYSGICDDSPAIDWVVSLQPPAP